MHRIGRIKAKSGKSTANAQIGQSTSQAVLGDETRSGVGKSETWMHRIGRIKTENQKSGTIRQIARNRTRIADDTEPRPKCVNKSSLKPERSVHGLGRISGVGLLTPLHPCCRFGFVGSD